jgi:hypothetical protein
MVRVMAQVAEGGHASVGQQHDVAARPAVAAIRAAAGDMRFAAERGRPVATIPGCREDPDMVSEHRGPMIATGLARPGEDEGERRERRRGYR